MQYLEQQMSYNVYRFCFRLGWFWTFLCLLWLFILFCLFCTVYWLNLLFIMVMVFVWMPVDSIMCHFSSHWLYKNKPSTNGILMILLNSLTSWLNSKAINHQYYQFPEMWLAKISMLTQIVNNMARRHYAISSSILTLWYIYKIWSNFTLHIKDWEWTINFIPHFVMNIITNNFNGETIKVWEWMINFIPHFSWVITFIIKCGMKLLNHSQTSMVKPLKFGNG